MDNIKLECLYMKIDETKDRIFEKHTKFIIKK